MGGLMETVIKVPRWGKRHIVYKKGKECSRLLIRKYARQNRDNKISLIYKQTKGKKKRTLSTQNSITRQIHFKNTNTYSGLPKLKGSSPAD